MFKLCSRNVNSLVLSMSHADEKLKGLIMVVSIFGLNLYVTQNGFLARMCLLVYYLVLRMRSENHGSLRFLLRFKKKNIYILNYKFGLRVSHHGFKGHNLSFYYLMKSHN